MGISDGEETFVLPVTVEDEQNQYVTYSPLDIGRFLLLPERKVYCFVIKSALKSDTLLKLVKTAKEMNILVLFSQFSMPRSISEGSIITAFLDFTDALCTSKEFANALRRLDVIKKVSFRKPTKSGFVADTFSFPLKIGHERVVIFREPVYESFLVGIRERLSSAGEMFLYYMGFDIGARISKEYKRLASSEDVETLCEVAKALVLNLGWAILEVLEIDLTRKTAKIRLYDNFECKLAKRNGKAYSQFFRGAIAGIFTEFFEEEVSVEEVKCIAKGDSFCEFHIEPAKH